MAVLNRKNSPTSNTAGDTNISKGTLSKRCSETFEAALRIHGGTVSNTVPAAAGLVETLVVKFPQNSLVNTISRKRKLCEKVFPQIYNKKVQEFETSEQNQLRSISVYFAKGVMGKRKYRSVCKTLSMKRSKKKGKKFERLKIMSCKVSKLLPYEKLMACVKSIDIGWIGNVREDFCYDFDEEDKVEGCYRSLTQFLPFMASFYLRVSQENLLWFNNKINTFHVVVGGDGAPFGKDETACSWLVSFLNRGRHILSSNENFLIFGANCSESSLVVQRYVKFLFSEMSDIENKTFQVNGTEVKFTFSEFPNDLKMLAFLAGELSVSATYFSTFANVNTGNCDVVSGTFGPGPTHTWQPWRYNQRVAMAKEVEKLKLKLEKQKGSKVSKRKKVTSLISDKKSRQEFVPLLGQFVDRAHIEPLHPKNNACQQLFRRILYESIGKSALDKSVVHFDQVPSSAPFSRLVNCLQKTAKLPRLAKKVRRWFNETNASGSDFQYRFTGQDSRMFLHNFMLVIDSLKQPADSEKQTFTLHVFAYICLQLRQIVSIVCRVVSIRLQDITQLKGYCANLFRACCLFTSSISPTIWSIGHIIPAHALEVFNKYQLGLNCVSMEGRESKHMAIGRYSTNTNFSGRWGQIFSHEFVQLVWLRERGFYEEENLQHKQTYIPKRVTNGESCFCGFEIGPQEQKCHYCSHKYMDQIEKSIKLGKLLVDKKLI